MSSFSFKFFFKLSFDKNAQTVWFQSDYTKPIYKTNGEKI